MQKIVCVYYLELLSKLYKFAAVFKWRGPFKYLI